MSVLLVAAISIHLREGAPTYSAPMIPIGRVVCIRAKLWGKDAILEVDTGSFEFRIDPEFIRRNHIQTGARQGENRSAELTLGEGPSLAVPAVIQAIHAPKRGLSSSMGPATDAIVGLDFLRDYAIGINRVGMKVDFWRGGGLAAAFAKQWVGHECASGKLTAAGREDWFRVPVSVAGKTFEMIFDTGTAYCSVNPTVSSKLNLKLLGETDVEEIGTSEKMKVVEAGSLTILGSPAPFPILTVENADDPASDGILGMEALGRAKFLLDLPAKQVYFWRAPGPWGSPLEKRLRAFGVDSFLANPGQMMLLVDPSSAAYRAGIRSGDLLVSLGGVLVADYLAALTGTGDFANLSKIGLPIATGKPLELRSTSLKGSEVKVQINP